MIDKIVYYQTQKGILRFRCGYFCNNTLIMSGNKLRDFKCQNCRFYLIQHQTFDEVEFS